MSSRHLLIPAGLLCLVFSASRCAAQSPEYHAELAEKTSGHIIVVNDSDKPMEAYHVTTTCTGANGFRSAMDSGGYDVLTTPWAAGGQSYPQYDVIAPHTRKVSEHSIAPEQGCNWTAVLDGVIFSDGSYGGSPDVVQSMQAWRDGLAASVQYWADRMRTVADPQSLDIPNEAKQRSQEDQSKQFDPLTPGGQYWQGRFLVDGNLAQISQSSDTNPRKALRLRALTSQMVNEWVSRLDRDLAFQALDVTFPLRPEMLQPPKDSATPCPPK